jgi:hypothetical protein
VSVSFQKWLTPHRVVCCVALLCIPLFAWLNIGGQDFDGQFYAAGRGWIQLYDAVPLRPLETGGYHGIFLPWAAVLTQPLSLLPLAWARAVVQAVTLAALLALVGPRPLAWVATLASAPALFLIFQYANLDALSAVGVLFPPAGGLLLLAAKPQAAGLAAVVWLARGRWRAFVPLGIVVVLSTFLWPEWIVRVQESPAGALNVSLFPYGLVVAIPVLVYAIRRNDVLLAALLTPLAVPYVAFYSLAPTIALLARRHWGLGLVAAVSSWGVLWLLMERLATLRQ